MGQEIKNSKRILIIGIAVTALLVVAVRIILGACFFSKVFEEYYIFHYFFTEADVDLTLLVAGIICIGIQILIARKSVAIHFHLPQMPKMKKKKLTHKTKKWLCVSTAVVIVMILCGLGVQKYVQHKNAQQEQAGKQKQTELDRYVRNATTFKYDATVISNLSSMILSDYHDNWVNAIWNNTATDANGHKRSCSKFQTAVEWRIEYFTHKGCLDKLDSLETDMSAAYVEMDSIKQVPEKYASLKTSYNDIRSKVSELVELCKNPSGNITEFGNTVNDMTNGLSTALKETDIYIDSQEEASKSYILELFSNDD